ncbi:SCO family protein [Allitabrizicola rongguiensis]|uniref:SCO family protein n=1 Tax=Alitabrizicola rongguiensis TaxID=2909234 RepID=UPI001F46EA92|nr:SCO family protein [Tabrizicola rongguiensis]
MRRLVAGAALVAAVGFIGWQAYQVYGPDPDPFASCRNGQIAGGAGAIGGPFTLIDGQGRTVTDKDVITEPTLVYFGYTSCPDVCPLDNLRNSEAVDILEERGISATPLFISIDPDRDTAQVMADYAKNMHPKMIGLTGSADQVRQAAQAYRVFYRKQDDGGEFYLVDHSTFTYLVLPGTGFVDFFRRETTSEEMAERVACFTDRS